MNERALAIARWALPRPVRQAMLSTYARSGAPLLELTARGLRQTGWIRSARLRRPVGGDGSPLPWYTYAAIDVLTERLPCDARVFEYGVGHSTLWYEGRAAEVVGVEHNEQWAKEIGARVGPKVTVVLRSDQESYVGEIAQHGGRFDVVAVDGVHRRRCAEAAIPFLSERGIVVWDNSEAEVFAEARARSEALQPFRELRLSGFGPVCTWAWSTSILYRDGNCLDL